MPTPPTATFTPTPPAATSVPASPHRKHPTPAPTTGAHKPVTTTWYTSPAAVAAARRMAAEGTVGDPACSLAAVGRPDPALVPRDERIGIGSHGGYWCLIR
ncbi:hypothetical protein AB0G55_28730 [Streptomyces toyocaensis]|uniref:hypothetical protein n=1 Tax=Streptomyces toyocaensis TaxID=55952 RepID=UPI00340B45F1